VNEMRRGKERSNTEDLVKQWDCVSKYKHLFRSAVSISLKDLPTRSTTLTSPRNPPRVEKTKMYTGSAMPEE
jgi:hypothetical protein